jgi:hypothetical protein
VRVADVRVADMRVAVGYVPRSVPGEAEHHRRYGEQCAKGKTREKD